MDASLLTMVRNYRSERGWSSVVLSSEDAKEIQQRLRESNAWVLAESMKDATEILASYAGPYESRTERICQLAMFLASKRIVDVRTACEEFLRAKIWEARHINSTSDEDE